MYEQDDVTNAPLGVAAVCRNNRFHVTSAQTRYGINQKIGDAWLGLNTGLGFPVTGAECFKYEGNGVLPDKQVPVLFDQNGNLLVEQPAGSGTLIPIVSAQVTPGANNYMESAQTLNRAFLAFTNIANPAVAGSTLGVIDLNTGILDPLSMRPLGQTFAANTRYQVGEVVTPLPQGIGNGTGTGRSFRVSAITTGISGAEPSWPFNGASVVSGGVTLTENTFVFSNVLPAPDQLFQGIGGIGVLVGTSAGYPAIGSPASGAVFGAGVTHGAGAYAANRDVYVAVTLVNGNGETNPTFANAPGLPPTGAIIVNTTLNDQLNVRIANNIPPWINALTGLAAATGWKLYVADVATGAAAPALAAYHLVGGVNSLANNTQVNVNATGAGVAPPIVNSAILVFGGLVDAGPRWGGVLFVNRNGCISGYGAAAVVQNNINISDFQIFCANVPIGPANTAQRIVFFGQAGGTSAGPFAYIPSVDTFSLQVMTATVINDNVTTTASFNLADTYLEELMATLANVTNFFDKIQVPPCRSIAYSETQDRMIYLAYELPSGAYISLPGDPESVFQTTGELQVAETDGQNLMGVLDYDGVLYGLKERSGYEISTSTDNPVNWTSNKRWAGVGPCGLRAFDAGLHFIVFAHRSGVWLFDGTKPRRLTKEIPITWGRVNWAAGQTIWVKIDDETHEIHVGVPLDRATVPSHTLTINFEEDVTLSPPTHSTVYSRGKFISSSAARKWSVQDIAANSCVRTLRTVAGAPAQFDTATIQSQLWFASSYDGAVRAQTPGVYTDDGNTVNWTVETVCPGDALKLSRLGGAQGLLRGNGAISVSVLAGSVKATADGGVNNRQTEIRLRDAYVKPGATTDYKCGASGLNERFRLRFSTAGKPPGTWGDLLSATLYTNPLFTARTN